ncbi:hypothetical protein NDU88_006992 [Pleurodeles waltl]|uniref:Uncharacterized protein n=1 Tax=Pleurodeles waltl TaxID=8319 RepID=A0AAV7U1Q0_PLEWA|nr:hypothetical protein NDU88_006992 [Pleurodeles waltl]
MNPHRGHQQFMVHRRCRSNSKTDHRQMFKEAPYAAEDRLYNQSSGRNDNDQSNSSSTSKGVPKIRTMRSRHSGVDGSGSIALCCWKETTTANQKK